MAPFQVQILEMAAIAEAPLMHIGEDPLLVVPYRGLPPRS